MEKNNVVRVLQYGMSSMEDAGGVETYLISQYRHIDRSKVQYDFIARRDDLPLAYEDEIVANGSVIYRVCSRHFHPIKHYWGLFKLFFKLRGQYSALVINASTVTYGSLLVLAIMAGIGRRIYHTHTKSENFGNSWKFLVVSRIDKFLISHLSTDFWACSEEAGQWMFGEGARFRVVRNSIDFKHYLFSSEKRLSVREELALADGDFVLGMIGNFDQQKNHEFAVDVFAEIHRVKPNSKLLLIGGSVSTDGALYARVRLKVDNCGLSDSVIFLGHRTDVDRLLNAFDVLIMPSLHEGFGIVALEAQASGLVCYLSDAIPRVVAISDNVRFLSLRDSPVEWASRIMSEDKGRRLVRISDLEKSGYDVGMNAKAISDLFAAVR